MRFTFRQKVRLELRIGSDGNGFGTRADGFEAGRPLAAQAVTAQQWVEVSTVLISQQSVEIGIGAGIQRVDEDQQYLGMGHIDQRVTGHCRQAEEGDGRHAGQIGEHQQRHLLGHGGVRVRSE